MWKFPFGTRTDVKLNKFDYYTRKVKQCCTLSNLFEFFVDVSNRLTELWTGKFRTEVIYIPERRLVTE